MDPETGIAARNRPPKEAGEPNYLEVAKPDVPAPAASVSPGVGSSTSSCRCGRICGVVFLCLALLSVQVIFMMRWTGKSCADSMKFLSLDGIGSSASVENAPPPGNHAPTEISNWNVSPGENGSVREERFMYLGILSAPTNHAKRQKCREAFVNDIRSGLYKGVHAEFVIGHLPYQASGQGTLPTRNMLNLERSLVAEREKYGDIARIVLPEKYENLPDKTFVIVHRAVQQGWKWIIKIDDDQAANMMNLLKFAKCHDWRSYIYAGNYLWDTKVYQSQTGADGSFAQYFGGPAYLLSRSLALAVTVTFETHSAEFLTYGSSSEDVDMGQWVLYISKKVEEEVEVLRLGGMSQSNDASPPPRAPPLESITCPKHKPRPKKKPKPPAAMAKVSSSPPDEDEKKKRAKGNNTKQENLV